MTKPTSDQSYVDRQERVVSHALVDVKRFKFWPFGIKSAVLLDISATGFKLEFTGHAQFEDGDELWLQIPLSPFGLSRPKDVLLEISVKWFDRQKMRMGGVFRSQTEQSQLYLSKIIEHVKQDL